MHTVHKDDQISENSENSYLVETTFNSEIDIKMRQEIEKKFKNSKINQSYIFPRMQKYSLKQSKRNLSTQRHNPLSSQQDKSVHQQEIFKIYSREQIVLQQIKTNFNNQLMHKSRTTSKKHTRFKSSPYRSKSPNRQLPENPSNSIQPSTILRKNKYLPEGIQNYHSFLPKIPLVYPKLTAIIQKKQGKF